MESILNFVTELPDFVFDIITLLTRVFAVLFIFFSTKYRNGQHRAVYYILAVLMPIAGVVFFAVKRKEMNGAGMNVCPSCHCLYPTEFKTCYKCNIDLPEYKEKKGKIFKSFAYLTVLLFAVLFIFDLSCSVVRIIDDVKNINQLDHVNLIEQSACNRESFTDENGNAVYYDKKGIAYSDPDDVVLYTKKKQKYVYNEESGLFTSLDGEDAVMTDYAFVDSKGYFVVSDDGSIYAEDSGESVFDYDDSDIDGLDLFSEIFSDEEDDTDEYYRPYHYTDDKGRVYYDAMSASWDENGDLISEVLE